MTARRFAMEVLDVTADMVSSFRGGFAAVAAMLGGRSEKVLRNKLSKYNDTHHLTLQDFIDINRLLVDEPFGDRALQALCFEFGGVFMPLPTLSAGVMQADDVTALLRSVKEHGEAMAVCGSVLMGGARLSEAQYQEAERECLEALAALRELMVRLRERCA
ncbi:hypothetical protein DTO96_102419 [Ephemeroptericola cinctiostellae]|uniref:Uncharacterized protein n=1 Tax=Ephemeroptericola cinctiostellae TaxID=2268024 RepID=A0A345DE76_9BURK|nr:phage regulatory CII family protein [Ephemeroptericola cinctiostellae]AXF86664.1 hypothetical protein DTO96_102419 [Ephemeroptericola cinctiostellae]